MNDGATIYYNDKLTITASANTGYKLTGIYAAGSSISSGSSITVTGNTTVSATTEANGYVLKWPAKPAGAKFTILKQTSSTSYDIVTSTNTSTAAGETILPYGTVLMVE